MKFKNWEHLVNFLIILTVIGIAITWFVQTVFAARFRLWVKSIFLPGMKILLRKVYDIIDNLTPGQKEYLKDLATKYVKKSTDEVFGLLQSRISLDEDEAEQIVKAGAKKVRDLLKVKKT